MTLIAVAAADPRTSLPLIEARVKDKGKAWAFAVAWDDGRKTSDAWLKNKALGAHPAFVVDRAGKLAFLGSPIQLDVPLAAIVAGTWDPAKGERWLAAASELETSLGTLTREQMPAALARLEALVKECPALDPSLSAVRFELLLRLGRHDEGDRYGARLVDEAIAAGDSGRLNGLAWSIVGPEFTYERRNLDLALRAAGKAVELTQQRDGMILDTLARVYACKQDWKKALELQRRAVLFNPQDDLRKALKEYEEAVKKADAQEPPKRG